MIVTDSCGLQGESPKLRKPFLLLRNVSERPEAFDGGLAKVVGTERTTIVQEAERLLNNVDGDRKMTSSNNPYGGGRAVKRIVDVLVRWLKGEKPVMTPFEGFDPPTQLSLNYYAKINNLLSSGI